MRLWASMNHIWILKPWKGFTRFIITPHAFYMMIFVLIFLFSLMSKLVLACLNLFQVIGSDIPMLRCICCRTSSNIKKMIFYFIGFGLFCLGTLINIWVIQYTCTSAEVVSLLR